MVMTSNVSGITFAAATLLLLGFSIATARAEETAAPKRSAYPNLGDNPLAGTKPRMTATELEKFEKLKKELSDARDCQSQATKAISAGPRKP